MQSDDSPVEEGGMRFFALPSASAPTLNRFGELTYAGSSRFVAGPFCEFGPTITD